MHSPCLCGWRSANRPPTQYPIASDTSTTPIVFAHTIVEAPKNGAISRAAAISAPSEAAPTTNTSRPSGGNSGEVMRFMRAVATEVPTSAEATIARCSAPAPETRSRSPHLWHPFTQMQGFDGEDAPVDRVGRGVWLIDTDGRRYIDGVSSLWCNVHGHRHPHIDAAVRDQLGPRRPHHDARPLAPGRRGAGAAARGDRPGLARRARRAAEPGVLLRQRLDGGRGGAQDGVPVLAAGAEPQPARTKFVCLENSYHGDTVGSVSVGGIDLFHSLYRPLLFDSYRVPAGDVAALDEVLTKHGNEIAAVVVEPLVQGAAGMLLQPSGYLRAVRGLCDAPRRAAGLRRGGDRLRPHGPHVRVRARGRGARLPVPGEGAHRRLHAARGDPHDRARVRGLPGRVRGVQDLLPRPHVHRQPARLRGRDRHARAVRAGAHAGAAAGPDRAADAAARPTWSSRCPTCAEVRRMGFMCGIELAVARARRAAWATR